MNSRLEQFVRDHREEFDSEEPVRKVWENIQLGVEPGKKKTTPLIRLNRTWWSAAAAVILIVAGGLWYMSKSGSRNGQTNIAANTPSSGTSGQDQTASPGQTRRPGDSGSKSDPTIAQATTGTTGDGQSTSRPDENNINGNPGPDAAGALMNEEMFHYARLVEIKHKELKTIEKDEPLLYKQFASEVNQLDSVYHTLEQQLPKNPNREQLLEAMLQNLQLQMGLLNHQLDIIKEINHSKKTAYEKAYKTA